MAHYKPIRLKYFQRPDAPRRQPEPCAWCGAKKFFVGGGFQTEMGQSKIICEECAIERFADEYDYRSITAAAARRRRTFDVPYLFHELCIDQYLEKNGGAFEEIPDEDRSALFEISRTIYNHIFTPDERERLEVQTQRYLEHHFGRLLALFDFTSPLNFEEIEETIRHLSRINYR